MARRRTTKKNIKPPLLYVEWADHHANGSWQTEVDHTPIICCSVGWLVKEDRHGVSIVGSRGTEDKSQATIGNSQYIIKSCILKRQTLK